MNLNVPQKGCDDLVMDKQMVALERFKQAQEYHYARALAEIEGGRKRSHWMWFIFPQIKGLGNSRMTMHYAIQSKAEAVAYLSDSFLRNNLITISTALRLLAENNPQKIFGDVDALKLQSSMTLFASISPDESIFHQVLDKYYGGKRDVRTICILERTDESFTEK